MPKLRYGRIGYVNVAPIETAFDVSALALDAETVSAVPTALNTMLLAGDVDVAAISAAHFLANRATLERVGDLCIAADGPVRSVLFASPVPPALLGTRAVAVTAQSASGRKLLETILRHFPGVEPSYDVVDDALAAAREGRPTLLIGDEALTARATLPPATVHDLGEAWREWTGLPFVFAVWAVRKDVYAARRAEVDALIASLQLGRAWGAANPAAVIDAAVARRPFHRALYVDYFARLSYTLDARARSGLDRFASLAFPEETYVAR